MRVHVSRPFLSVVLALAAAAPLQAQRGIELNVLAGYYLPTGQFEPSGLVATGLPLRPSDLKGVSLGGAARLWLGRRWGMQLQAGTAASTTPEVATPGGCCAPMAVRVSTFSAQALYDLRRAGPSRLWLGAGPAVVRHGGEGYARFGSPTFLAGSVGAGLSVRLGGRLRGTADAGALLYDYRVHAPTAWGPFEAGKIVQDGFRKDLRLGVGLGWRVL